MGFFAVSAFILAACLVLLLVSFNREYFQYYLNRTDKNNEIEKDSQIKSLAHLKNETMANLENLKNENNLNNLNNLQKVENNGQVVNIEQNEANLKNPNVKTQLTFCELFKRLWDLDLIVVLIYVVTFTLFPYATINQKLFGLNFNYSSNTIILIYNAFDTIGRYIVELFTPTKRINIINAFSRIALIFFIIFNFYGQDGLGWNVNVTSVLIIFFPFYWD